MENLHAVGEGACYGAMTKKKRTMKEVETSKLFRQPGWWSCLLFATLDGGLPLLFLEIYLLYIAPEGKAGVASVCWPPWTV